MDAVTATPDTIRAAAYTAEGARLQKRSSTINLVNSFGRGLRAHPEKHGWLIYIAPVDSPINFCAVRKGSGRGGGRVRTSRLKQMFRPVGDRLTYEQAETLMIEFLSGAANPPSVDWLSVEWR